MAEKVWKCPLCGNEVVIGPPTILPEGYFERCKLKEQIVNDACIAYDHPDRARELLAKKEATRH
jgi:hypothetical protein